MLTAKQILEQGIVIPSEYSQPAQVGIDLSLASVHLCTMGSVVFKDRTHIDPLGFKEMDRVENIRRVSEVAKLMNDGGLITIASFIAPYEVDRQRARTVIGDVFVNVTVGDPSPQSTTYVTNDKNLINSVSDVL